MLRPQTAIPALFVLLLLLSGCTLRKSELPEQLKPYQGHFLLVHFWSTWCASCVAELPEFEKLDAAVERSGIDVVTVAVLDREEAVQALFEKKGFTLPVILDGDGSLKDSFGLFTVPSTVLVHPNGHQIPLPDPASLKPTDAVIGVRNWIRPAFLSALQDAAAP